MPGLTIENIPKETIEQIQKLADAEHRSINQQVLVLIERALHETPGNFTKAYSRFRERMGPSPLRDEDLKNLRLDTTGRTVDL